MFAIDTSMDALRVAQANTDRLGLGDRVDVVNRGVASLADDRAAATSCSRTFPTSPRANGRGSRPEIREYEPREALVAGADRAGGDRGRCSTRSRGSSGGRRRSRSRSAPSRPRRSPSWFAAAGYTEVETSQDLAGHRPRRRRAMTEVVSIERDGPDAARAALERCVGEGGVAIFPADTLYGLACDPLNAEAIERIHAIKGRGDAQALGRHVLLAAGDAGAGLRAGAADPRRGRRPAARAGDPGRREPGAPLSAGVPRGSRAARRAADRGTARGSDDADLPDQREPQRRPRAEALRPRSMRRSSPRPTSRSTPAS